VVNKIKAWFFDSLPQREDHLKKKYVSFLQSAWTNIYDWGYLCSDGISRERINISSIYNENILLSSTSKLALADHLCIFPSEFSFSILPVSPCTQEAFSDVGKVALKGNCASFNYSEFCFNRFYDSSEFKIRLLISHIRLGLDLFFRLEFFPVV